MTESFKLTLALLIAVCAAVVVGLYPISAAFVDGQYIPVGPDSFYHARRVLDAVADPAAFYQFDASTHVPEGHLITWPWLYDFVMSLLVRAALALHLSSDPTSALLHIPVLFFALTPLVVSSIGRSLGLSTSQNLLAMLATVFFPLNQAIYSVGNIDHHYAEHLFVLGTLAGTLGWLRNPASMARAIGCGVTFGLATGIHSALFVLQLPLLGTFVLLWLRRQPLPKHTAAFAVALVLSQIAIALPSLPLRRGLFDFYYLSWFQPYVAACTAVATLLLARLPRTRRGGAIFVAACAALGAPMAAQFLYAHDFFSNAIGPMEDLSEVKSVVEWARTTSVAFVAESYTWLVILLPATMLLCLRWLWRPRDAAEAHFALVSLGGLVMLLTQVRMQYFGSFALYVPWLVVIARAWPAGRARIAAGATAAVLVAVAYLPGLRSNVFTHHTPAEEPNYAATRSIYPRLAAACERRPGVVLSHPYEGHYIRYHSRCAVIANNFLVTPQDVREFRDEERLLDLPASAVAAAAPDVRYVLVRRATLFVRDASGAVAFAPGDYPGVREYRLVRELLAADERSLPPGYELIYEMRQSPQEQPFARLFALAPVAAPRG